MGGLPFDAMQIAKNSNFLAKNDWRIPTKNEFETVVCHKANATGDWTLGTYTASGMIRNAVRKNSDYPGDFSSTTPHAQDQNIWFFSFATGYVGGRSRNESYNRFVRLVRAGQDNNDGSVSEFNREYDKRVTPLLAEVKAQRQAQANQEEQRRQAEMKAEREFQAFISNKNPQTMYLAAGSYERNGDGNKASQIYEAIIAKFPSSSWAVKANDQLNDSKRSRDAQSAANQRQYNAQRASDSAAQDAASKARSQCSYRIDKCEDSCRPLSGSSKSACWSSCKSLCNQF